MVTSNTSNLGNSNRCQNIGAFGCRNGKCINRHWVCNERSYCKDNSDRFISNDTVCGMYINYCLKRCVLISLFLPHTAVKVYSTNNASTALQQ